MWQQEFISLFCKGVSMKFVRRRKKYCLRSAVRIIAFVVCCVAGVAAGASYVTIRNSSSSQENRTFICVLSRDLEAGEVIADSDIKEISVVKEEVDFEPPALDSCIGKQVKTALKKDTMISAGLLCTGSHEINNIRKLPYSYVKNAESLQTGDYVDVRISFPNGADFIILSKKEVLSMTDNDSREGQDLWLGLDEEEILRMSSGVVDAYLFEGAYIYAALYMNPMQKQTVVNYPVNEVVEELIKRDPNIIQIAQNQKTLELRSRIYENAPGEEKEQSRTEEESLIYFN